MNEDHFQQPARDLTPISPIVEEAAALMKSGDDLAEQHRYDEAIAIAARIRMMDFKLRIIWHDELYGHLIHCLLDRDNPDRALELTDEMESPQHRNGALGFIVQWSRDRGRADVLNRALALIGPSEHPVPSVLDRDND